MKRILAFALLLATIPLVAGADLPSHRKAVESFLVATNITHRIEISKKQVLDSYSKAMSIQVDNNFTRDDADALIGKIGEIVDQEYTWEKLKDRYIDAYLDLFSEAEVNELVTFFKSPVGVKYIGNMPMLNKIYSDVSRDISKGIRNKLKIVSESDIGGER